MRGAPDDVHTWIRLGVTYRASGKHVAALKVFARALTIDPSSWYAKFCIGDVQRETGLYEAAIETFREILLARPEELGVQIVLSETLLCLGQEQIAGGFSGRGERSLVDSLKIMEEVISKGLATRVAWKVTGDALSGLGALVILELAGESTPIAGRLLAKLEEEGIDGKIEAMDSMTTSLLAGSFEEEGPSELFAALAVLAFKMRVLLETQTDESVGSAWLDLGMAISSLRPLISILALDSTSEDILNQAIRCLKNGLRREPLNSIFWNALGVLSFDLSPRLAQHSFIKAIEHSPRSAVPLTNLGIFYLFHHDEELANQAFLKAQVLDPDWTAAWVGQAILAEMAGHSEESTMLFQHAFTLVGTTPEADIGFATTAFAKFKSTITPTDPATSLSAPIFALSRYLSLRPTDFNALHLNGLLLEQVGDLPTASESLEKAVTLLEELYEVDESAIVESQFVIAQTNLGRIRLASEDYEGAVTAFDTALSLIDLSSADTFEVEGSLSQNQALSLFIECKLGIGLAHYYLKDGNEMEIWESTLEDLDSLQGVNVRQRGALEIVIGQSHWLKEEHSKALSSFMDSQSL